jgi:predicted TIM-barrel fold metal-dependent hydrolase
MKIRDAHCHFFSPRFFQALGRERDTKGDAAVDLPAELGWDPPGTPESLADRWIAELDRHGVSQAMLIASIPGDEESVAIAVRTHPGRFLGAFMFNPRADDAEPRLERAFGELGLRIACLLPAMHHVPMDDASVTRVFEMAERHKAGVFVHCGLLSVGARVRLGLPSRFDLRLGDPLAVAAQAVRHPAVPVLIPHFGGGMFREALMAVQAAASIRLDTSSSNNWIRVHPGLTLRDVFARALDVAGPRRLVFGTDSSFFPRGWHAPIFETQRGILEALGVAADAQARIFGDNLAELL